MDDKMYNQLGGDFTSKDQPNTTPYQPMEANLRPLIIVLKCYGLFHEKPSSSEISPNGELSNAKSFKITAQRVYCFVVCVLFTISFLKCIPAFWVGYDFMSGLFAIRVVNATWILQCGINCIIMFYACYKDGHLNSFFHYYNTISTDEIAKCLRLKTNCHIFARRIKIRTAIILVIAAICEGMIIYMTFSDVDQSFSYVATSPLPNNVGTQILFLIVGTYCIGAWFIPLCFFIAMCSVFRHQFHTLSKCLEKLIENEGVNAIKSVNYIRIKHHQFTKAIQMLDADMGKFLIGTIATGICLCCFLLYDILNNDSLDDYGKFIYAFWLICNLAIISSSSVSAALVNSKVTNTTVIVCYTDGTTLSIEGWKWKLGLQQVTYYDKSHIQYHITFRCLLSVILDPKTGYGEAHSALEHIYDLDLSHGTPQEIGNVNMFLSKLNGSSIGFTTMDILTITKELLLTLLGVFATYFFLLLQFQI